MTQFLLGQGRFPVLGSELKLQIISAACDEFLVSAARSIFPSVPTELLWTCGPVEGGNADMLFNEASLVAQHWEASLDDSKQAVFSKEIEETRLFCLLQTAVAQGNELAVWYGSDWEALPVVHCKEALIREVFTELADPGWAVYLRYVPERVNDFETKSSKV